MPQVRAAAAAISVAAPLPALAVHELAPGKTYGDVAMSADGMLSAGLGLIITAGAFHRLPNPKVQCNTSADLSCRFVDLYPWQRSSVSPLTTPSSTALMRDASSRARLARRSAARSSTAASRAACSPTLRAGCARELSSFVYHESNHAVQARKPAPEARWPYRFQRWLSVPRNAPTERVGAQARGR